MIALYSRTSTYLKITNYGIISICQQKQIIILSAQQSKKLVLNSSYVDATNHADTPLGKLMHDFMERDPEYMYYETLKKRANYFKNTKEGANTMGNLSEKLRAEGKAEGIKSLVKYLKKSATKAEAIKTLMGAYGLSEDEALRTYTAV